MRRRIGRKLRTVKPAPGRVTSALRGLASDDQPVDPNILLAAAKAKFGSAGGQLPGFSHLREFCRDCTDSNTFILDDGRIAPSAKLVVRVPCGRVHPGLCVTRDASFSAVVKKLACKIHDRTQVDLILEKSI